MDLTADFHLTKKLAMLGITLTPPFVITRAQTQVHPICYLVLSSCLVIYGKNSKVTPLQARCGPEGG